MPTADYASQQAYSITSSARASSGGGTFEVERLGGLEVDDQFILGRRLHRQVCRLFAFEDTVDVTGRAPELVEDVCPVGYQAAIGDRRRLLETAGNRCRAASVTIRSR